MPSARFCRTFFRVEAVLCLAGIARGVCSVVYPPGRRGEYIFSPKKQVYRENRQVSLQHAETEKASGIPIVVPPPVGLASAWFPHPANAPDTVQQEAENCFSVTLTRAEEPQAALTPAIAADIGMRLARLAREPMQNGSLWPFAAPLAATATLGFFLAGGLFLTEATIPMLVSGLVFALSRQLNRERADRSHALDALALAPFDIRWTGPMIQSLASPYPRIRGVAAQTLRVLLPLLEPQSAALLLPAHRSFLNHKLLQNRRRDLALNLATLKAWERVGQAEDVPYVEGVAVGRALRPHQRELRRAARACLESLEARLEQEQAARQGQALSRSQSSIGPQETAEITPAMRQAAIEVDAQLALLDKESKKHKQPGMRTGFLMASWGIIVPYTAWQVTQGIALHSLKWTLCWTLATLFATQLHRFALSGKQSEAARALAKYDDVRGVGKLAEALEWPEASVQHEAEVALTRLLPRMKASDAGLLDTKQRGNLYGMLKMRHARGHGSFLLAVLDALEQIGDDTAIPIVERLAKSAAYTKMQKRVQQRAMDCLPALRVRATDQNANMTLLRASSVSETPADLLLRGAMMSANDAPEQLLRASLSGETPLTEPDPA